MGTLMIENLTHSETTIGPKRLKLVGIKHLWMVRVLFEILQSDQPKEAIDKS